MGAHPKVPLVSPMTTEPIQDTKLERDTLHMVGDGDDRREWALNPLVEDTVLI